MTDTPLHALADGLRWVTFATLAVGAILLYAAHRRSRATVFTDVTLKATALVLAVIYLGYIADNAESFGVEPDAYSLLVSILYVLIGAFFLSVATYLYVYARRDVSAVIVSPEFLVGLRSRMMAMYGPTSASFVSYAVGKESAQKAFGRLVKGNAPRAWRRLPHWFRLWGYGHMKYLEHEPGRLVRLRVAGTFEASSGTEGGCDLTRGYLAGLGKALVPGMDCEAEETHCSARDGGDACEFSLRWFEPMPEVKVPVEAAASEAA